MVRRRAADKEANHKGNKVGTGKKWASLCMGMVLLVGLVTGLAGCGGQGSEGDAGSVDAGSQEVTETTVSRGDLAMEAKEPLDDEDFQRRSPAPLVDRCSSNGSRVKLVWRHLPGAETYLIQRAEEPEGEYSEFAETDQAKLAKKTDGDYYYRIQAIRGELKSKWSRPVHVCSVGAKIESFDYEGETTRMRIRVSNHTDRTLYFYGAGLYDGDKDPHYRIEMRYLDEETKQKKPFPLTAQLDCPASGMVEIPAGDDRKVEILAPVKISKLGESGLSDDLAEYQVRMKFSLDLASPDFFMLVREQAKRCQTKGRLLR